MSRAGNSGASGKPNGPGPDAEARYRRADALGDAQGALDLGDLLARRGDWDQAELAYRRADERGHARAAAKLGELRRARGDIAGAEAAFRRADERGDPLGALDLGLLLGGRGDWEAAKAAYARADLRGGVERTVDSEASPPRRQLDGAAVLDDAATRWAVRGISPVLASLIGIALVLIAGYFAFTKAIPFQQHYTINAVLRSSNLLVPGSPVRIEGLDVGKVTAVSRYRDTDLAQVQMQISDGGQVHQDATVKIRPRLFLEGNFYVDLSPGTPESPAMPSGGTIPVAHTSGPVQIDQVLDAFPADTRTRLQQALQGFGAALDAPPTAAENAAADPAVRGLTGAQAINKALYSSPRALRDSAIVSEALTGPTGRELSQTVSGLARASDGLARADTQLTALVSEFDRTMQATAAQQQSLRQAVALLGPTAQNAQTAFGTLDAALAPTERFARDLARGIPQIPATITAAYPWLAQAKPLLSRPELPGLLHQIAPATADIAKLTHSTRQFLPQIDAFDRCITDVFLPTGNIVVNDGPLSSGVPNYREFWYAMAGQAAEAQGADGNGNFLRIGAAGGPDTIETGQTNYYGAAGTKFAQADLPPLATRPAYPNRVPALNRAVPCYTQPVPRVNGPGSTGPADGARPNAAPPPLPNDPTGKIP